MRRITWVMTWLVFLVAILPGCNVTGKHDPLQHSDGATTAFIHVNVVPMTNAIVIEDQTVLIEGDRIVAVGPGRRVSIPENATIIDGGGAYLMPGLADMHMHTRQDWESDEWPVFPLLLYLANGVTTIRDFGPSGKDLTYALRWREQIDAGTRIGPRIYTSGKILFVSPLGDPKGLVHENHDLGFDFLKLYSYLAPEDFHEALTAAKELGMYSAGHVPYAIGLESTLAEGMNEIAHVEELLFEFIEYDKDSQLDPDEWITYLVGSAVQQFDISADLDSSDFNRRHAETMTRIIEQLHSAGAPVCTTLVVDDVIQLKLFQSQTFLDRPGSRYLPVGYLDLFRRGEEKHQLQFRGVEDLAAFKNNFDRWILVRLHQAGIPLLLGTDSGTGGMGIVPGFSIHDELRILVENGFSPYESIATGTANAAAVIERMVGEGDFGAIEVGKRADLLLVNRNPLEDVSAIRDLRGVMAAGRWYSREALDQMIEINK
jgi:imidazolonepropionase-like amidohydrolase